MIRTVGIKLLKPDGTVAYGPSQYDPKGSAELLLPLGVVIASSSGAVTPNPNPQFCGSDGMVYWQVYPNSDLLPRGTEWICKTYYKGFQGSFGFVLRDVTPTRVGGPTGTYWDIVLDNLVSSVPDLPAQYVQGPEGPPGPPGESNGVTFTQSTPLSEWDIVHNLGHAPVEVSVMDQSNEELFGPGVVYISVNQIKLTFGAPVAGTAFIV